MPQAPYIRRALEQNLPDPVLSEFAFPLRATFYPLGFPLILETNSADVIQAMSEGWGPFPQEFETAPMRFCLGVAADEKAALPAAVTFRSREHMMSIFADADNFVVCDFNQNFAFGWVTQSVAANYPFLRYHFLSAAVLSMVQQLALAPLHSALIVRNGCGVALFGESFAGKSTLAYACARAGWTFVCDDSAFLVRDQAGRYAIGDPYTIRLRADAGRLFSELAGRLEVVRPNGKLGIEVFTRELPIATASGCLIEHLVLLNRNEPGPAQLRRYPKDEALVWFERVVTYGTSEVRASQRRCYQRLWSTEVWELCYQDFGDAIDRLGQLVGSGS
jgi:hypothetical protein